MYWLIIILLFVAVSIFMVWASADIGSGVYVKSVCKGAGDEKVVALTFDDGPEPGMTDDVLNMLRTYGIKATFFLIGSKAERHPELVRRIKAEGHLIGNHTYSHNATFPMSNTGKVFEEIENCSHVLTKITGLKPRLFRPPFGVTNPIIGRNIKSMGLQTIGWSVRSFDTRQNDSRQKVCKRVLDRIHPGAIILLHDRCMDGDKLLEMMIPKVLEMGYSFKSLDELTGLESYNNLTYGNNRGNDI